MRIDSYKEKELDVKLKWILSEKVIVFLVKIFTIIRVQHSQIISISQIFVIYLCPPVPDVDLMCGLSL